MTSDPAPSTLARAAVGECARRFFDDNCLDVQADENEYGEGEFLYRSLTVNEDKFFELIARVEAQVRRETWEKARRAGRSLDKTMDESGYRDHSERMIIAAAAEDGATLTGPIEAK